MCVLCDWIGPSRKVTCVLLVNGFYSETFSGCATRQGIRIFFFLTLVRNLSQSASLGRVFFGSTPGQEEELGDAPDFIESVNLAGRRQS